MNAFALFGLSILMSFVSAGVVAKFYVWPWLRITEQRRGLAALVAPHLFLRFMGLSFLVPGVVSPSLPLAFAAPAAYGDFVAGILAIVAAVALVDGARWGSVAVWLFNVWGAADFIFAFYQGWKVGLQPGALGAAFFIVTALVPPLLVSHFLIFGLLLRRNKLRFDKPGSDKLRFDKPGCDESAQAA
jgi:hypothetical protein